MGDPVTSSLSVIRRLAGMPPPPSRLQAMLKARRAMVDAPYTQKFAGIEHADGSWEPTSRKVFVSPVARDGSGLLPEDAAFLANNAAAYLEASPITLGFFEPSHNLVAYPAKSGLRGSPSIRRHEVMHGMSHAAASDGTGLPMAARMVGGLRSYDPDSVFGQVGLVLDELVAQQVGGTDFGNINWGYYANNYANRGKGIASRLARGMQGAQIAAENLPAMSGGIAGTGLLGYALTRTPEEKQDDLDEPSVVIRRLRRPDDRIRSLLNADSVLEAMEREIARGVSPDTE